MNRNKQGLKKYRGLLTALVLVTMVICGCSRLQTQKSAETELAEGQRKAEIQVVSITNVIKLGRACQRIPCIK